MQAKRGSTAIISHRKRWLLLTGGTYISARLTARGEVATGYYGAGYGQLGY